MIYWNLHAHVDRVDCDATPTAFTMLKIGVILVVVGCLFACAQKEGKLKSKAIAFVCYI